MGKNPFTSKEAFLGYAAEHLNALRDFDNGDGAALSAEIARYEKQLDAALDARDKETAAAKID